MRPPDYSRPACRTRQLQSLACALCRAGGGSHHGPVQQTPSCYRCPLGPGLRVRVRVKREPGASARSLPTSGEGRICTAMQPSVRPAAPAGQARRCCGGVAVQMWRVNAAQTLFFRPACACPCRQCPDCPRNGKQVRMHHVCHGTSGVCRQAVTVFARSPPTAVLQKDGKAMHQDLQVRIPACGTCVVRNRVATTNNPAVCGEQTETSLVARSVNRVHALPKAMRNALCMPGSDACPRAVRSCREPP